MQCYCLQNTEGSNRHKGRNKHYTTPKHLHASAMNPTTDTPNFSTLRECLTAPIIRKASLAAQKAHKGTKNAAETTDTDVSELSDFIDYLTTELWPLLPPRLQTADYNAYLEDKAVKDLDSFSLKSVPLSFSESLIGYDLVADDDDVQKLIVAVMEDYVDAVCAPPPVWVETRTEECEICERNVPLTYHHLIPVCVLYFCSDGGGGTDCVNGRNQHIRRF